MLFRDGSKAGSQPDSCGMRQELERGFPFESPALSTRLFYQPNIGDRHFPVHGLAHIVDREAGYGNGGQRFHLYAGPAR